MLENAVRICEAVFGAMLLREGDGFRRVALVALHNAPLDYEKSLETEPFLRPTKTLAHLMETMPATDLRASAHHDENCGCWRDRPDRHSPRNRAAQDRCQARVITHSCDSSHSFPPFAQVTFRLVNG